MYNRVLTIEEIEQLGSSYSHSSVGDFLNGGPGDDLLYSGESNNILEGGLGADEFWLRKDSEIPFTAHTIVDFEVERDLIGIDMLGVSSTDIGVTQVGNDSSVKVFGMDLVNLLGIQANDVNSDHFILI